MIDLLRSLTLSVAVAVASLLPSAAQEASEQPVPAGPAERFGYFGDITIGNPDALPVKEFISFTCPHCGHFAAMVLPGIKQDLIDKGHIKLILRNLVRDQLDMAMVVLARCRDGAFAEKAAHKVLLEQSRWLSAPQSGPERMAAINALFGELGMEEAEVQKCLTNQELAAHVFEIGRTEAMEIGVESTPTIVVNGRIVNVAKPDDLTNYLWVNHPGIFEE